MADVDEVEDGMERTKLAAPERSPSMSPSPSAAEGSSVREGSADSTKLAQGSGTGGGSGGGAAADSGHVQYTPELVSSVASELASWLRATIDLPGVDSATAWTAEHSAFVEELVVEDAASLPVPHFLAYPDSGSGSGVLHLHRPGDGKTAPPRGAGRIFYFLRLPHSDLRSLSFSDCFQFGSMRGTGALPALVNTMEGVFIPYVTGARAWPERLRKDFTSQVQRFMAVVTEGVNRAQGKTVLYFPPDQLPPPKQAVADKELVQRLEALVIHWTRQIKEVISSHDGAELREGVGPLEEVAFWRRRADDLSGIAEQLGRAEVARVVAVLRESGSSFLRDFEKLMQAIQQGTHEAQDNARVLQILVPQCQQLVAATPGAIPALLPGILDRVRVVSTLARYYRTKELITGLLTRISNDIMGRCKAHVPLSAIFHGDLSAAVAALQDSVVCCEQWRVMYNACAQRIRAAGGDTAALWATVDTLSVFAQVDAFVQRCKDLLEVCESKMQFDSTSKDAAGGPHDGAVPGAGAGEGPDSAAAAATTGSDSALAHEREGAELELAASSAASRAAGAENDAAGRAGSGLPIFGGAQGPEITKSLQDIQDGFRTQLVRLRDVRYNLMDVQAAQWHEDYNYFRLGVKELERAMQKVINRAFASVTTIAAGLEVLEGFESLAKSPAVRQWIETKTGEMWKLFLTRVRQVKQEFDALATRGPQVSDEPQLAGRGMHVSALNRSISQDYAAFQAAWYLPKVPDAALAKTEYNQLHAEMRDYVLAQFRAWTSSLGLEDDTLEKGLERSLLVRGSKREGVNSRYLENNFDPKLLTLFAEAHYWQNVDEVTVPSAVKEVLQRQEGLRVMHQRVTDIVRRHNTLVNRVKLDEERLFADQLRKLDKKLTPGLGKLTWMNHKIVEKFVHDAARACDDFEQALADFQAKRTFVEACIQEISSTRLLDLEKNHVYLIDEFYGKQERHRAHCRERIEQLVQSMAEQLAQAFAQFLACRSDVHKEWRSFIRRLDRELGSALSSCVLASLSTTSRAINGDSKNAPSPIFLTEVTLNEELQAIEPSPIMDTFKSMIAQLHLSIIAVTAAVPRLIPAVDKVIRQLYVEKAPAWTAEQADRTPESFYDSIRALPDIDRLQRAIAQGVVDTASRLTTYMDYWTKYGDLWRRSRDAFMRRYEASVRAAGSKARGLQRLDADIASARQTQSAIQGEDHVTKNIDCLKADCSPLKATLIRYCIEWQACYTGLLNKLAREEVAEVKEAYEGAVKHLTAVPASIPDLHDAVEFFNATQARMPELQDSFGPIRERYDMLQKYEVPVPDAELKALEALPTLWDEFSEFMQIAQLNLQQAKKNLKRFSEEQLDSFIAHTMDVHKEAKARLPYAIGELGVAQAMAVLEEFDTRVAELRADEQTMTTGLKLFGLDSPDPAELREIASTTIVLREVWGMLGEWEGQWLGWKAQTFGAMNVEEMDNAAAIMSKRLMKCDRQARAWEAWTGLRQRVDEFRQMVPLIQNLANKAMRGRHWAQLMQKLGTRFDPSGDAFTLAVISSLGLQHHAEFIGELSATANKELSFEQTLQGMRERWAGVKIEFVPHKGTYLKLGSTEEVVSLLDDDQNTISTMKSSRFYQSFQEGIDYWAKIFSAVSEVLDVLGAVQRQWMYLESIFTSSEDIRRQLPSETHQFDAVNATWKAVTTRMNGASTATQACSEAGLVDTLQSMGDTLERIQKSLDDYLETKRQLFPRFYFLSNDDLLEILGQQKDPAQVQKHIKKCFEGIAKLKMETVSKRVEGRGMVAPDGEEVAFESVVVAAGAVETWLGVVESTMVRSLQFVLDRTLKADRAKGMTKEKWINSFPGQMLITAGKIQWTADVTRVLTGMGGKLTLKRMKKRQVKYLAQLADIVRSNLGFVDRQKTVALVTMEIHSRDVLERMIKSQAATVNDFIWLSQLRFYFEDEGAEVFVCKTRQTNTNLYFGYEYQGNNGRLVITPLTDRCVLTLTTALHLQRGGNPLGPAGTGKTETVKDLGKNLAKYVVVFNCSDGLDYKSVGRMFSGLVQSGSWGCFDEFNRIEVEVLSVVAQQIMCIMDGVRRKAARIMFEGVDIACNPNCGIFVTMNPGYAGRSELPDNLKALMRPVAMMTPDLAQIAEVMLMAEGFLESRALAKKTVTLYELMVQQLSKQDHYDYGLRSLKAVLNRAGTLKREQPSTPEDTIILRALRDMNMPKFVRSDAALFVLLLGDLFPGQELPASDSAILEASVVRQLEVAGLQPHPAIIAKAIQLHESKLTRHCNMLVGHTLGGKSTTWKMLAAAKTALAKESQPGWMSVRTHALNPKSVTLNELYGSYDLTTMEWTDGVLSTIFRTCAQTTKAEEQWIMLDGPVDTLWIESMNTVMDDNKTLTLINGDRIPMSASMSLVFEVQDLAVASPATVSRAGMVYVDSSDLGWSPYVQSWLARAFSSPERAAAREVLQAQFDKVVAPLLHKMQRGGVRGPVSVSPFNTVITLCSLLDSFLTPEMGVDFSNTEEPPSARLLGLWFAYATVWSVGASVGDAGRGQFNELLRALDVPLPSSGLVYDWWIDTQGSARPWEERLTQHWQPEPGTPFFKIVVPTVDVLRHQSIVTTLLRGQRHVVCTGETGTGKSVLAQRVLDQLDPATTNKLAINFSAATSSGSSQSVLESAMEKRAKDRFGPLGGRQLVAFIDDLNMPKKDAYGSQPPLELLKQWMDYGGWYNREKQTWRFIVDTMLLAAMGPPGGGRQEVSSRIMSRFSLLNFTFPEEAQIRRIFESILVPHFVSMGGEQGATAPRLVAATLMLYKSVIAKFLPTPAKAHYLFNMRDISKVVQGLLQADVNTTPNAGALVRMWIHESMRVFADRFVSNEDHDIFLGLLGGSLSEVFNVSYSTVAEEFPDARQGPVFTSLVDAVTDGKAVAEVRDIATLKQLVEDKLDEHNMEPGFVPMSLVVFRDALLHVCRIARILGQPRGNAMLIGVGGSGRQSLTKLASFIKGFKVFQIEMTKNYRVLEFREDMKRLYAMTGIDNKPTVFLFSDTQLKDIAFLEDINNILSSGIIPNMYDKDSLAEVIDGVRDAGKAAGIVAFDALWEFFIERVRDNLHVVLAMSPVGDGFRDRTRKYPSLVNCTTMDWFREWPSEALQEVAFKFLEAAKFEGDIKTKLGRCFAQVHQSVALASVRMMAQLKRMNYVTPTNYLELVRGYTDVLREKQASFQSAAQKLKNGLSKLEQAREQVQEMSIELGRKQEVVAMKQKDCEQLLTVIVSERQVAEEQQRAVEAESLKIGKEELECKTIADSAQADLNEALPALQKALAEVDKLDKSSISEVKAYTSPPPAVELVLSAVMTLFDEKPDWATAKRKISEPSFLSQIKSFDKDNVPQRLITRLKPIVSKKTFNREEVAKVSSAAAALCVWVMAINLYAGVVREVAPKREALLQAQRSLAQKQQALKLATDKLAEVTAKVKALQQQFDDSVAEKNRFKLEADTLQSKLERAGQLVSGLAGERERWQSSIAGFEGSLSSATGDALVAAAMLSYAGPFDSRYRSELVQSWLESVQKAGIPHSEAFSFASYLADPVRVREWNLKGLPTDTYSTENAVMATRGRRWPLMIDPQGQANKWIKNLEGSALKVCDQKMKDFMRELENAVQFGMAYLLQEVGEELDPSLEPVLNKAIIKIGTREVIRIGDKDVDYSKDFRLYITTKLNNPHYTPEVSTKVTITNFAVKEVGLEAQLLGIVVQEERDELEKLKSELVVRVASGKNKLVELEDTILRLLSDAKGSLLDDDRLVGILQDSKTTSEQVQQQLAISEETERAIDAARLEYKPIATRASILFFVLDELASVDPMYQYSLDSYVSLFITSIRHSRGSGGKAGAGSTDAPAAPVRVDERVRRVNDHHTYAVYTYACRGLFERHKLLLSFQMCSKLLAARGELPAQEFNFFLRGGSVAQQQQRSNPCAEWLTVAAWDAVCALNEVASMQGIAQVYEQNGDEMRAWFMHATPETAPLPGDWQERVTPLQKLCLLRAVRPDRVIFATATYVSEFLGPQYVDPPPFNLREICDASVATSPLIFVLSPGVDPIVQVQSLATELGRPIASVALGQGQAEIAERLTEQGMRQGSWVFLANCHLMTSWMPVLEKLVAGLSTGESKPHPQFRLWLSSSPTPKFPVSVLQRGVKMTTEPPSGLRNNMLRLYNAMTEEQLGRCRQGDKFRKLLFSLSWFHSILLERRKFKSLGFNIPYEFNDSDFSICEDILSLYLNDCGDKVPWDALRYLVAEANYGGRVTDAWDRRLVNVYSDQFFCNEALTERNFKFSTLDTYVMPPPGGLDYYKEVIRAFPATDRPEAFGQHPNADITSQMENASELLATLVDLQPRQVASGGETDEQRVLRTADELLLTLPQPWVLADVEEGLRQRSDPAPLQTVLLQELQRYNELLRAMSKSLTQLKLGIQGLVVITAELEAVFAALLVGRVPAAWGFCFPSLKPLPAWTRDLALRVQQMDGWATRGAPTCFWLSGFTYPTGFLTALLQATARRNAVPIDSLSWEFPVLDSVDPRTVREAPEAGAYVHGMFLEGARWDEERASLADAAPMELFSPMPIVHFKPVEGKRRSTKGMYVCPLYMYPLRTGTRERPSFMTDVLLSSGAAHSTVWVKRGTALLLSLSA